MSIEEEPGVENGIHRILEIARRRAWECEVYGEDVRSFRVDVHRDTVESMDRASERGIGIRLVHDGRIGFAFTTDIAPSGLTRALEEAHANAACSSPMDVDHLADNEEGGRRGDLYPVLPSEGGEHGKVERVRAMEGACFGFDAAVVNTEGAHYYELVAEIYAASTRGFFRREKRGICLTAVAAVAQRNDEVRSGFCYAQALHPDDIDFTAVGRTAAGRAVKLLGSKRIATKRYPVVIDGAAFVEIVDFIAEALSAEMVVKGMSVLAGRQGEVVARDVVSIVDDPFKRGGCFNAGFDAEGVLRKRCALVESGVLAGYLHNVHSSRKMAVNRSGNAVRRNFKNLPLPGPSNLYLAPGTRSAEGIIADIDEGVYVQSIMGMHTADTISGDFSVGINGFHITGGTMGEPVSEMTMSGSVLALLQGIVEVGCDLVFIGPYGAPTVFVEGISVSGT